MRILFYLFVSLNIVYFTSCQIATFIKPLVNGTCGISTGGPLVQQLTTTISYAGGLLWIDEGERIAYVDRYKRGYGRYTPKDGRFNHMFLNEGRETTLMIPIHNATGLKFVIGVDNRLVLDDITGSNNNFTATVSDLLKISDRPESFIIGKCDTEGRLWYTSVAEDGDENGYLYKIDNLTPQVIIDDLIAGAGMAWTNDDKFYYLVDSFLGVVYKFDFDNVNGTISNQRTIFKVTDYSLHGTPFDLVVDLEGYLWIGLKGGGNVIQYDDETGSILWSISIPAMNIVSLEFGGLDKRTLYVGTEKEYGQSASGAIFAISGLGATGISSNAIVIPE